MKDFLCTHTSVLLKRQQNLISAQLLFCYLPPSAPHRQKGLSQWPNFYKHTNWGLKRGTTFLKPQAGWDKRLGDLKLPLWGTYLLPAPLLLCFSVTLCLGFNLLMNLSSNHCIGLLKLKPLCLFFGPCEVYSTCMVMTQRKPAPYDY